jgi:hypothetical protein
MEMPATSLADDLLEGADAIAAYVYGDRKHRRKVYHRAATHGIPTSGQWRIRSKRRFERSFGPQKIKSVQRQPR